jgi:hypothetical protein
MKHLKALSNHFVRNYLNFYKEIDKLYAALQEQLVPDDIAKTIMELAKIRSENPETFEKLITSYENSVLIKKQAQFASHLMFLQKILGGIDFILNGEVIAPEKLAKTILTPFENKNVIEFSIGEYKVNIEIGIQEDKYASPYHIIHLYKMDNLVETFKSSILTSYSSILSVNFQKFSHCIGLCFESFGYKAKMKQPMGSKDLTILGHIINDKSVKQGKQLPKWFDENRKTILSLRDAGHVKELRDLLKKEYAKQKGIILPESMEVLYEFGKSLIRNCKSNAKKLDPNTGLIEKIYTGVVNGFYQIKKLEPMAGVAENTNKKIFLLAYRNKYQIDLIHKVLANAGWGGSIVIASLNFPSINEALETGQVEYLIQSELGHAHEKDLYDEEIKGYAHAKDWEGKVLQCHISDSRRVQDYAEDFTEEKISKFHYRSIINQSATV